MGNNAAFRAFEAAVIRAYDDGLLTSDRLAALAEPYRNSDIDAGGSEDLVTADSLGISEVIVKTMNPTLFAQLQTERAARIAADEMGSEQYWDDLFDAESEITSGCWGWI